MNLLSKKELLIMTNISYGQLYRWKRENLIPDEWFIKKSSYTGQETFFPREQILSRIKTILELKDTHSLEEIAEIFTPKDGVVAFDSVEVNLHDFITIDDKLVKMLEIEYGNKFKFNNVVFISCINEFCKKNEIMSDTAFDLICLGLRSFEKENNFNLNCIITKLNEYFQMIFINASEKIIFDINTEVIGIINFSEESNKLKLKLKSTSKGE